jgi:hypothetical protein
LLHPKFWPFESIGVPVAAVFAMKAVLRATP